MSVQTGDAKEKERGSEQNLQTLANPICRILPFMSFIRFLWINPPPWAMTWNSPLTLATKIRGMIFFIYGN